MNLDDIKGGVTLMEPVVNLGDAAKATLLRVRLIGLSPMLMDHWSKDKAADALVFKKKTPPDTTTPLEERCGPKIYRNAEGQIVIPASNFASCLVNAGKRMKLEGNTKMTNSESTNLFMFLTSLDADMILVHPKTGEPLTDEDWEVDTKIGRLPKDKTANLLVRPLFKSWSITCNWLFEDELAPAVTQQTLLRLFKYAGRQSGLGSFNPAHKGMHGMFEPVEWDTAEVTGDLVKALKERVIAPHQLWERLSQQES